MRPDRDHSRSVLFTAQPFGFGPAAALALLFPGVREAVNRLDFVGAGHTLDLHSSLPYDHMVECELSKPGAIQKLHLAADYDLVVSACDFAGAEILQQMATKVCIYDMLAWFWPEFAPICLTADLYIAQDFFGVQARVGNSHVRFRNVAIVPPLIPRVPKASSRQGVIVNLGGIFNPYISETLYVEYVDLVLSLILQSLQGRCCLSKIFVNKRIATSLGDRYALETGTPFTCVEHLASSQYAFLTPGLGNIYEAAHYSRNEFWLPPCNTSQGRQLRIIQRRQLVSRLADWHQIVGGDPIDYFMPQDAVLERIGTSIAALLLSRDCQNRFQQLLEEAIEEANTNISPLQRLKMYFDGDGIGATTDLILRSIDV